MWVHYPLFNRNRLSPEIYIICPALHEFNVRFPFGAHGLKGCSEFEGTGCCRGEEGSEDKVGARGYDEDLVLGREMPGEIVACVPFVNTGLFLGAKRRLTCPARAQDNDALAVTFTRVKGI